MEHETSGKAWGLTLTDNSDVSFSTTARPVREVHAAVRPPGPTADRPGRWLCRKHRGQGRAARRAIARWAGLVREVGCERVELPDFGGD
jgi:hypothetical protein